MRRQICLPYEMLIAPEFDYELVR
ncbi:hypothetical protein DSM3645_17916 [Blastopirellula marina DSM 3645]|uniref:Uncharacterized protein n=1 Tax=Blastopirellula marina DSM 3645 TaxID=314230 RepID=A4A319_9BACT|nr:hypothetical protein DSM3645_17916 [Blastopirellula marina DSM 3645]